MSLPSCSSRSASPAVFAVVPMQIDAMRDLRWRYLHGHPASDSKQCYGGHLQTLSEFAQSLPIEITR